MEARGGKGTVGGAKSKVLAVVPRRRRVAAVEEREEETESFEEAMDDLGEDAGGE